MFCKAIMKSSQLKPQASKSENFIDIAKYVMLRNFVVKLTRETFQ